MQARDPREPREALVVELASAMHAWGSPSYRVEDAATRLAEHLGVELTILSIPTALQMAFGVPGEQRMHLLRVTPKEIDQSRLCELDDLLTRIETDAIDVGEARLAIRGLRERAPQFGPKMIALGFALASGSAAVLFGGTLHESLVAALLGLILAPLTGWLGRSRGSAGLLEPVAAFFVAYVAYMLSGLGVALVPEIVTLGALIVIVPGFRFTVALTEIATGHVVSGMSRLGGAASVFVLMLLGVVFGRALAVGAVGVPEVLIDAPPPSAVILATAVAPFGFFILFSSRRSEMALLWIGSVATVVVARGVGLMVPESLEGVLAGFVGALFLGLLGNEFDRRRYMPASVMRSTGLIMLVPGALGLQSLESMFRHESIAGVEGLFATSMIAAALAGGLLAANLLRPPRGVV